jgi:hypothetical protein
MFGPNIKSIKFDTTNWNICNSKSDLVEWRSIDMLSVLTLNYFDKKPDLPCNINDINNLRTFFVQSVNNVKGAVLNIDVIEIENILSLYHLFKVMTQNGMLYIGTIIIPFMNFSYVIKVQSIEGSMKGIRESVIMDRLLSENIIKINDKNEIEGWFNEKIYGLSFSELKSNLSDEEKYDSEFEDHPLTLVRNTIKHVKSTMNMDKKVSKSMVYKI